MGLAQYEVKKAEADAGVEVFSGQPSLAVPAIEINANAAFGRVRQL
jgi:hypothetical protein